MKGKVEATMEQEEEKEARVDEDAAKVPWKVYMNKLMGKNMCFTSVPGHLKGLYNIALIHHTVWKMSNPAERKEFVKAFDVKQGTCFPVRSWQPLRSFLFNFSLLTLLLLQRVASRCSSITQHRLASTSFSQPVTRRSFSREFTSRQR